MRIKIQENEMITSAKKIESEIEKLEILHRELKNMLNSTSWDMRAKKYMENQVLDARRLNSELTSIIKRMSDMIKLTAESMKNKDIELSKNFENNSLTLKNMFNNKMSIGNVGWELKNKWAEIDIDMGLLNNYIGNGKTYISHKSSLIDGEVHIELGDELSNFYYRQLKLIDPIIFGSIIRTGQIMNKVQSIFPMPYINEPFLDGMDIKFSGYLSGTEGYYGGYTDSSKTNIKLGISEGIYLAKGNMVLEFEILDYELGIGVGGSIGKGVNLSAEIGVNSAKLELGVLLKNIIIEVSKKD